MRSHQVRLFTQPGTVAVDGQIEAGRTLGRFEVYVYFYHAGDHQQPVTYVPAGEAVMLESGRYDLRTVFYRSNDQPNRWLRDFLVKPGETVEYTVSFPSGTLLVRAYDGGGSELIGDNVFVYVYAAGQRSKPVTVARSGELVVLTAGEYDVLAEDTRAPGRTQWLVGVQLEAGLVSEHLVSF